MAIDQNATTGPRRERTVNPTNSADALRRAPERREAPERSAGLPFTKAIEAARGQEPARELDLEWDAPRATVWCFMRPRDSASFTAGMLGELIALRRRIQAEMDDAEGRRPRYFVGGSRLDQIFNLGGDLKLFVEAIRARDQERLRAYAYDCVDVSFHMNASLGCGVTTIALVQGDAMGGGFEGAMSFNCLVAERQAKFGLPEILFNLFPGMGAHSFLFRRLNVVRAQEMIMGGEVYTADEMHELGIVDHVVEPGQGRDAVAALIDADLAERAAGRRSRLAPRREPVPHEELRAVTDVWVEAAMNLGDGDLRRMERLVSAQGRKLQRGSVGETV